MYVCPKSKLLKKVNRKRRRRYKPPKIDRLELTPTTQAHKIDGIWYEITLKEREPISPEEMLYLRQAFVVDGKWLAHDRIVCEIAKYWSIRPSFRYNLQCIVFGKGFENMYAASKRQFNSRELRRYGLENDAIAP